MRYGRCKEEKKKDVGSVGEGKQRNRQKINKIGRRIEKN